MPEQAVDRFQPTSGRVSGVAGLLLAGVVLVLAVTAWDAGTPLGVAILAALGALLVWAALLRPALWATDRELVMRGMFHTDRVPLAAIEKVSISQVTTVRAAGRRFVSPVVGYSVRHTMKDRVRPRDIESATSASTTHQAFVESRLAFLAQDARDRAGIRADTPEQRALADDVRRTWAWPEIVGAAVLVLAFVVWLLV